MSFLCAPALGQVPAVNPPVFLTTDNSATVNSGQGGDESSQN